MSAAQEEFVRAAPDLEPADQARDMQCRADDWGVNISGKTAYCGGLNNHQYHGPIF